MWYCQQVDHQLIVSKHIALLSDRDSKIPQGVPQVSNMLNTYRVGSQLLTITVQLNVSYYGNKQDHSKSSHTDRLDICECALVCLHMNDLAYCHNKAHLTEQSFSVAGHTPCI